jgi:hypothetical protein
MQVLAKSLVMYRAGRRGEELVSRELFDYKMARDPQSIPGFLKFIQERLDEGRLPAHLLKSLQSLQEFVKNNQKDPNSKYFHEIVYRVGQFKKDLERFELGIPRSGEPPIDMDQFVDMYENNRRDGN